MGWDLDSVEWSVSVCIPLLWQQEVFHLWTILVHLLTFVSSLPPSLGFPQLGIGPVLSGGAISSAPLRLTFVLSIGLLVVW